MIVVTLVTFFLLSVSCLVVPNHVVGFTFRNLHYSRSSSSTKAYQRHCGVGDPRRRIISSSACHLLSRPASSSNKNEQTNDNNSTTNEHDDGASTTTTTVDLYTEVDEMLDAALLMYPFADIREFARQGKLSSQFLQSPISARKVGRLIEDNEEQIRDLFHGQLVSDLSADALGAMAKRQYEQKTQALLVEFQDLEDHKELVYGVGIDHARRRVTVAFRGSITKRDFLVDISLWFKSMPNRMRKYANTDDDEKNKQPKRVRVHAGTVYSLVSKLPPTVFFISFGSWDCFFLSLCVCVCVCSDHFRILQVPIWECYHQ